MTASSNLNVGQIGNGQMFGDNFYPYTANKMMVFNGYAGISSPTQTATAMSGAVPLDCSIQNIFYRTGGASTVTFSNFSEGQTVNVLIASTGSAYTITWTGVKWPNGFPPTSSQTAGRYDFYTFTKIGGMIFGTYIQDMY